MYDYADWNDSLMDEHRKVFKDFNSLLGKYGFGLATKNLSPYAEKVIYDKENGNAPLICFEAHSPKDLVDCAGYAISYGLFGYSKEVTERMGKMLKTYERRETAKLKKQEFGKSPKDGMEL